MLLRYRPATLRAVSEYPPSTDVFANRPLDPSALFSTRTLWPTLNLQIFFLQVGLVTVASEMELLFHLKEAPGPWIFSSSSSKLESSTELRRKLVPDTNLRLRLRTTSLKWGTHVR